MTLFFRRVEPCDLDFMAEVFSRPEVVAHRPDPTPDSREVCADKLVRDIAHWDRHGFGRWTVEAARRPVGFGGLTVVEDSRDLNVSYHVHPDHWGHGHASAIAAHAVEHGFGTLRAPRLRGLVRAANPASARVLLKLGFREDGEVTLHGAPTLRYVLDA
ncbi:GNAT family N-acetyltransferase [Pseudooceanicola sp. LIPI14-2-Ac024]|uniref:GNAT family N-acetyltransferase n=1 Tax=Pseudooceanicola sp. LIPI14-2-Ac024 TaxID=3344875 RepID=UPI0035CFC471